MTNKEILNNMLDNLNEEGLATLVDLLGDMHKKERYNKNTTPERLEELKLNELQEKSKKEQAVKEIKEIELESDEQAKSIKKILGNQPMEIFVKNAETLQALRRADTTWLEPSSTNFFDYYSFMFGYIQGIRAERTRKHKNMVTTFH